MRRSQICNLCLEEKYQILNKKMQHSCGLTYSVGSFVMKKGLVFFFGKSKNSLDYDSRYYKDTKKLGCHFF